MITIQNFTTKYPISMIGYEAGVCYGSDVSNHDKNYKRGIDCLESEHGRTFEFPDVYLTIEGYSARVIREYYTHIGCLPTRLQASTRYIDYAHKGFEYIVPPSINKNKDALKEWQNLMSYINQKLYELENVYNIPKEDVANGLPLGMTTKIVDKRNLRNFIDMSHSRECVRAYWEFRQMFEDIKQALRDYSEEWKYLVDNYFKPKCEYLGYCNEKKSCGKYKNNIDK